nr:MAG TPA: hypothetical protein [Caudoviricetes sp.]
MAKLAYKRLIVTVIAHIVRISSSLGQQIHKLESQTVSHSPPVPSLCFDEFVRLSFICLETVSHQPVPLLDNWLIVELRSSSSLTIHSQNAFRYRSSTWK